MNKTQKTKGWSNPYPKWVKSHSITSRNVVIILGLFIGLGILISYVWQAAFKPPLDRFEKFSDLQRIYPSVLEIAKNENQTAELAMVMVYGTGEGHEEPLDYVATFYFCSPSNETWTLQVGAKEQFGIIRNNIETGGIQSLSPENQELIYPNCQEQLIDVEQIDVAQMVERLRSNISGNSLEILEEMPRWLWIGKDDNNHLLWKALFKFYDEDYALVITYNVTKGEVREIEEILYPLYAQLGVPKP